MTDRPLSYWKWFLRGRGGRPGWRRLFDKWLILHAVVGATLSLLVPVPLPEAAKAVLLPLAGILIGLSFAWVGNAIALAQTAEIERLADQQPGGIEVYVFTFQNAILVLLVTLSLWAAAGLGVFDRPCLWSCGAWVYQATTAALYGTASMAIRECWQVVLLAQSMLLYQRAVRKLPKRETEDT